MKNFILVGIFSMFAFYFSKGQSCEVFRIPTVSIYLYPINGGISFSKLNDTVIYSLEKLNATNYKVQKLILGVVKEEHIYYYKGKYEFYTFRVKKRKIDKTYYVNEKMKVCSLE